LSLSLSLSFLFYERKLNTNLSFISGDLPFQGNYSIAITHAHTHTSSNVTVTNINKKHKTCCRRVLWKTLTWFYFRRFFLFRASLTKQYFISGLCHGFTFWTTTNTNLYVILVAFLAGTASQCKTFFSFAGGKSPHQSCPHCIQIHFGPELCNLLGPQLMELLGRQVLEALVWTPL